MSSRVRFYIRLHSRPEREFHLILATGKENSPFSIRENVLMIKDQEIASIRNPYDDAAVLAYFRDNKKVITLNSNSRSTCTGCVFCPNTLEGASDPKALTLKELTNQLKILTKFNNLEDLSLVREVDLSTGCFGSESPAIDHLVLVKNALKEFNCHAQIGMLSSVLRTDKCFERIKKEIGDFHLILTSECFERREEILKDSKASLTPNMMPDLLSRAMKYGHDTSFTYIVGLDDIEIMEYYVNKMAPYTNRFPNFQVYQSHDPIMDIYAAKGSHKIDFYLESRKRIENIFVHTPLRPKAYANYRPLWYFEFVGESLYELREDIDELIGSSSGHGEVSFVKNYASTKSGRKNN